MRKKVVEGDVFCNKEGEEAVVTMRDGRFVTIRFLSTNTEKTTQVSNLLNGTFRNRHKRTIYGVGFIGEGSQKTKQNNKSTRAYNVWVKMLARCYDQATQQKCPSYIGCSVCEDWHNYQNFANWYEQQIGANSFEIDKDLLVKGNKLYSPVTCILLPKNLNIALQLKRSNCGKYPPGVYYKKANKNFIAQLAYGDGAQKHLGSFPTWQQAEKVYNKAKTAQVREMAEEYKDVIDPRAYAALKGWST